MAEITMLKAIKHRFTNKTCIYDIFQHRNLRSLKSYFTKKGINFFVVTIGNFQDEK